MLDKTKFEVDAQTVAKKLGLTLQQVRWAEVSALRKLRKSKILREVLIEKVGIDSFDGCFDLNVRATGKEDA